MFESFETLRSKQQPHEDMNPQQPHEDMHFYRGGTPLWLKDIS
jgi:hypothetical protein